MCFALFSEFLINVFEVFVVSSSLNCCHK
jgi:hypothetical protein